MYEIKISGKVWIYTDISTPDTYTVTSTPFVVNHSYVYYLDENCSGKALFDYSAQYGYDYLRSNFKFTGNVVLQNTDSSTGYANFDDVPKKSASWSGLNETPLVDTTYYRVVYFGSPDGYKCASDSIANRPMSVLIPDGVGIPRAIHLPFRLSD